MIYTPIIKKDYEWINTENGADDETFYLMDGHSVKDTWKPILVKRVPANQSSKFLISDFPWFGCVLIFRKKVKDCLKEMLEKNGEILPLATNDGVELFVHNTQVIQNALNEEKSEIETIEGTNRILEIRNYAFNENAIKGVDLFRLPMRASETFVSEKFVDMVKMNRLVGLEFKQVWA